MYNPSWHVVTEFTHELVRCNYKPHPNDMQELTAFTKMGIYLTLYSHLLLIVLIKKLGLSSMGCYVPFTAGKSAIAVNIPIVRHYL